MSFELFDADDAWTVMNHPLWPELRRFIIWEPADVGNPDRLFVNKKLAGPERMQEFLGIVSRCAKCGRDIHPVRLPKGGKYTRPHLAVSCELDDRLGCARSKEASDEVRRIVASLRAAESA